MAQAAGCEARCPGQRKLVGWEALPEWAGFVLETTAPVKAGQGLDLCVHTTPTPPWPCGICSHRHHHGLTAICHLSQEPPQRKTSASGHWGRSPVSQGLQLPGRGGRQKCAVLAVPSHCLVFKLLTFQLSWPAFQRFPSEVA